ncbi:hypothetical protein H6501_01745 [Candidatus Woesearchaeota archaeon]|nr:hypothetical protein [Candidatus Woesearchaeota archaeon]USN44823.1 MAG: hypothetical protein H6500_03190 [Candidatus Woesearchaeota archaeon]
MSLVELITLRNRRIPANHSLSNLRLGNFILSKRNKNLSFQPILTNYDLERDSEDIALEICANSSKIIGLPGYIWTIDKSFEISRNLYELDPNIQVVIGGPEALYPSNIKRYDWNGNEYFISGEGEEPFLWLLSNLQNGRIDLDSPESPRSIYTSNKFRNVSPNLSNLSDLPPLFGEDFTDLFPNNDMYTKPKLWHT